MVDLDEYLGRGSRKRTKEKDASATRPSFVLDRPLGRVRATREHRNANRRPGASPSRRESNEYDDFGAGATGGGEEGEEEEERAVPVVDDCVPAGQTNRRTYVATYAVT